MRRGWWGGSSATRWRGCRVSRYGSSEFPFAVALKTGTSQGYRDAWTLEWSQDYVVGVWVGGGFGPMTQLSGARAAARLAGGMLGCMAPGGRIWWRVSSPRRRAGAVELCPGPGVQPEADGVGGAGRGGASGGGGASGHRAAGPGQPCVAQSGHAAGAEPAGATRERRGRDVQQIVWLVDGRPVAVGAPDAPLYWTLVPGRHRFQVRCRCRMTPRRRWRWSSNRPRLWGDRDAVGLDVERAGQGGRRSRRWRRTARPRRSRYRVADRTLGSCRRRGWPADRGVPSRRIGGDRLDMDDVALHGGCPAAAMDGTVPTPIPPMLRSWA